MAVLRSVIGFTQKEMARILECSVPTVQAVELGKLKLSIKLAERVFFQTGVSTEWLLSDDVTKPPVTEAGEPYTKALFEQRQAALLSPKETGTDALVELWRTWDMFTKHVKLLSILYAEAYKRDKVPLVFYKSIMATKELFETTIGQDKAIEAKLAELGYRDIGPVNLLELDETLEELEAATREELERKLKLTKEPLPKCARDYFLGSRKRPHRAPKKKKPRVSPSQLPN